jgi:hypothetical protein
MSERSFGEEFSSEVGKELVGKAVLWGPSIAAVMLLGPVGLLLGFVTSVAIVDSLASGEAPPKDPSKD